MLWCMPRSLSLDIVTKIVTKTAKSLHSLSQSMFPMINNHQEFPSKNMIIHSFASHCFSQCHNRSILRLVNAFTKVLKGS